MEHKPYLGPTEQVREHPFANPEHIPGDLNTLRHMVDQIHRLLQSPHLYGHHSRPLAIHRPDLDKWTYRLVISNPEQLAAGLVAGEEMTFVGFLGQRREDANLALAGEFDNMLIAEIPHHPGLLSYSTMALICGNFCNLVLFTNEQVKAHWSKSQAHAQAVGKLAPEYYLSVRLYNGILPHGVADSQSLYLTKIKYYSYQATPWWHAVRQFDEIERGYRGSTRPN
jgi:hypothetical protein